MSAEPQALDPRCIDPTSTRLELLVESRPRDIGAFSVRRVLPSPQRRRVGPFVFFDEMGPAVLAPAHGLDVRPHPHIGLATLTFLFDGEIFHRDSLGSAQSIRPRDVNWMVAGRGIVHSERSSPEGRAHGGPLHGIQSWIALPLEHEEDEPRFEHHPAPTIPSVDRDGVHLDVIAGTAFGARSPVGVLSPTLYVHVTLPAGASLTLDEEHAERGFYVVEGAIGCGEKIVEPGTLAVLREGEPVEIRAERASRVMLVGGAKLEGAREIWWNFVSSSPERMARAKADWKAGRFPRVPGDEEEFIPLPDL